MKLKTKRKKKHSKTNPIQETTIQSRKSQRTVGPHTVYHRVTRKPDGKSITMRVTSEGGTDVVTHEFRPKDKRKDPHYHIKFLNKKYRSKRRGSQ